MLIIVEEIIEHVSVERSCTHHIEKLKPCTLKLKIMKKK